MCAVSELDEQIERLKRCEYLKESEVSFVSFCFFPPAFTAMRSC